MSARPERSSAGAHRTGASAWRDPVDHERLHPGFRRSQGGSPGAFTVQPAEPHLARNPRSPAPCGNAAMEAGRKSSPTPRGLPSLNRWEAWPPVGLSPGSPPKVSSEYQLLDAPAKLARSLRSGSLCRWQLCSLPFRIPAFSLSGLRNTQPPA